MKLHNYLQLHNLTTEVNEIWPLTQKILAMQLHMRTQLETKIFCFSKIREAESGFFGSSLLRSILCVCLHLANRNRKRSGYGRIR
jgi:hypothetical protein